MANHETGPDTDSGLEEGHRFSDYLAKVAKKGGVGSGEATTVLLHDRSPSKVVAALNRLAEITEEADS